MNSQHNLHMTSPLLPTVEGFRKLLTDYMEAQWGMSILFLCFCSNFNQYLYSEEYSRLASHLDIGILPADIPWTDKHVTSLF